MDGPGTPGQRIRKLRQAAGLSPDELAEKTGPDGPSANTIARIEADLVRPFGPFLQSIADALAVSTGFILSGRNEPNDEICHFAECQFPDPKDREGFVVYAKDTSFRHKDLNAEELRILKAEFLRHRNR